MSEERVRIRFNVNKLKSDVGEILGRKVDSITKDPDLYVQLCEVYGRLLNPYVPYSPEPRDQYHQKHLAEFTVNKHDGIVYSATNRGFQYAGKQYYGDYKHDTSVHDQARSHWNAPDVQRAIWGNFISEATPLIARRFKKA